MIFLKKDCHLYPMIIKSYGMLSSHLIRSLYPTLGMIIIFMFLILKQKREQLTRTGSETVSNGHFGWLYEEELTGYDGYRWSPDSEYIAFWEEDEVNVPEFFMLDELKQYPVIKKIRYPKAGENNPSLRIGLVRVKGSGKKWIKGANTVDDYLPWMEWIDKNRIAYMKLNRNQKNWDLYVSNRNTGKSVKVLSESDEKGWLDNDGQIKFLKDGRIIWISEQSNYKHLWMSKHSGSKIWPITQGEWKYLRSYILMKIKKLFILWLIENLFLKIDCILCVMMERK